MLSSMPDSWADQKQMSDLARELEVYEKCREQLEEQALRKWVVIRADSVIGTYGTLDAAAAEAVRRFGRGPYLIREIGAADVTLPGYICAVEA